MTPTKLCSPRTALFSLAAALLAGAPAAQRAEPAQPVFEDGQAQVVDAFNHPRKWIRHDLFVETTFDSDEDGKPDRVHVDVTRPAQTETEGLKVPVIYETSPYYSGIGSIDPQYFWNPRQELGAEPPPRNEMPSIRYAGRRHNINNSLIRDWVPRGFAVVHSESPGTGASQGCPTVGGENETLAPKAVIDWLNGRAKGYTSAHGDETVEADWCTGKVGMTGTSYNGTLPIAVATTGVDGLEAIIPIAPISSYYHYYRSNGLVRHPGGYMGEDMDVLYDFINSGDPAHRSDCEKRIRDAILRAHIDRRTGDYNDFWAGRNYRTKIGKWRAATLMSHAFNDWNVMPEHSVEMYLLLKAKGVPVQAYFHQGGHGQGPPLEMMNRWFTRFLYGVDNGVENDPRGWIVREGDRKGDPTPYPDYPHPDAAPAVLHAGTGGTEIGTLTAADEPGQGTESLTDDVSIAGADLAQADSSSHRLLYATAELAEEVHLSGTPRITFRVASSKPAADLSVWLVSLPWTPGARITDNLITRGWADPQNHDSLTESAPLEPGEFYEMSFALQPDDQIIGKGQRIGLMLFSSDRDFTLWPPSGTELSFDVDSIALELPVVGGAKALAKALGE
jgi:X-Pro dipeptidyl-peptidase